MAGLVPAIHVLQYLGMARAYVREQKTWMAGTSPAMTSLTTSNRYDFQTARAVITSAAKQSILSLRCTMDCFAALAMTVFSFEPAPIFRRPGLEPGPIAATVVACEVEATT
jgi:hypothetical protein